jgi:ketosteroid isomerase-like protein
MTQQLLSQVENFQRVVMDRDPALAESVLDDGFMLMLVQPMPAAVPREAWLGLLPDYVVHEYLVEEQTVDVDGDTAAVLSRVRMRADVLGEDRSGTFVLTDVWRQRSDGWRVWRRHSTPATAGRLPNSN